MCRTYRAPLLCVGPKKGISAFTLTLSYSNIYMYIQSKAFTFMKIINIINKCWDSLVEHICGAIKHVVEMAANEIRDDNKTRRRKVAALAAFSLIWLGLCMVSTLVGVALFFGLAVHKEELRQASLNSFRMAMRERNADESSKKDMYESESLLENAERDNPGGPGPITRVDSLASKEVGDIDKSSNENDSIELEGKESRASLLRVFDAFCFLLILQGWPVFALSCFVELYYKDFDDLPLRSRSAMTPRGKGSPGSGRKTSREFSPIRDLGFASEKTNTSSQDVARSLFDNSEGEPSPEIPRTRSVTFLKGLVEGPQHSSGPNT